MSKKRFEYKIILYDYNGEVEKLSKAKGFEIYYGKTLKFPRKATNEIPTFPVGIRTVANKSTYIATMIETFEYRRLKRNQKQKEYRQKKEVTDLGRIRKISGDKRLPPPFNLIEKKLKKEAVGKYYVRNKEGLVQRIVPHFIHVFKKWIIDYESLIDVTVLSESALDKKIKKIKHDIHDVIDYIYKPKYDKGVNRWLFVLHTVEEDEEGQVITRKKVRTYIDSIPRVDRQVYKERDYEIVKYEDTVNEYNRGLRKAKIFDVFKKVPIGDSNLRNYGTAVSTKRSHTIDSKQDLKDYIDNEAIKDLFRFIMDYLAQKFTNRVYISQVTIEHLISDKMNPLAKPV